MSHLHDPADHTARRVTRSFLMVGSVTLTALAALVLAASPGPLTAASVTVWALTWLLGSTVSLALGAAVVYASVGFVASLGQPARPRLRATAGA
jgi:hypothetical protein